MAGSTRTVALVPIKANSERVEAKNFGLFLGRPLFQWILDTLLAMDEIDEIVINTDARSRLRENGLEARGRLRVRDRPLELCGDDVSINRIIADDIRNVDADAFVMTHVTNPLLTSDMIRYALNVFRDGRVSGACDSVFTVNRIQARFYRADGTPINHDPDALIRTQDLEVWYEENSNVYIFDREAFALSNRRIGLRPRMIESGKLESIDIDTEEDWALAAAVAQARHGWSESER